LGRPSRSISPGVASRWPLNAGGAPEAGRGFPRAQRYSLRSASGLDGPTVTRWPTQAE
jgi:hypothetical protein